MFHFFTVVYIVLKYSNGAMLWFLCERNRSQQVTPHTVNLPSHWCINRSHQLWQGQLRAIPKPIMDWKVAFKMTDSPHWRNYMILNTVLLSNTQFTHRFVDMLKCYWQFNLFLKLHLHQNSDARVTLTCLYSLPYYYMD